MFSKSHFFRMSCKNGSSFDYTTDIYGCNGMDVRNRTISVHVVRSGILFVSLIVPKYRDNKTSRVKLYLWNGCSHSETSFKGNTHCYGRPLLLQYEKLENLVPQIALTIDIKAQHSSFYRSQNWTNYLTQALILKLSNANSLSISPHLQIQFTTKVMNELTLLVTMRTLYFMKSIENVTYTRN